MSDNAFFIGIAAILCLTGLLFALLEPRMTPATCNELCGLGRVESYRFNTESKHYECFCRKD